MLHEMTMHDIVELQDTYIEYKEFIGAGAIVILHSYDCKTQCVIFTPIKTLYQIKFTSGYKWQPHFLK